MSTDSFDRLERLFKAAQLHPPEEREAFLDAACADNPTLREELESLLQADDEAEQDAFLGDLAADVPSEILEAASQEPTKQNQIGPYQILRTLGHGGMGDVFLAVREEPFKRYVALKVIRRGLDTQEVLQRFSMERQILASLNHSHISRLLDGGVTHEGLPYFAMEYVDGLPLTRYCDQRRLTLNQRLALFQTVCQAVHFAHQNLVIHRDLKPTNILVTKDGTVKLLDFGIAKLLNPHLSQVTLPVTRTEVRMMTPEYASPEQVRGEAMTTASDIYSLGVILYELLTGHRPYQLNKRSSAEIAKVVCEQDPERPSTMVTKTEPVRERDGTTRDVTPALVGEARGVAPERLQRRLRGDLDNIVMMALRKEPGRRYSTVEQFSQDVENYLQGRPVIAHRDSRSYRAKKFVQRHRIETLAAAIIALLLISFSTFTAIQSGQVARERDEKELEAQKAEQISSFLLDMFASANPSMAPRDTMMVRDWLEAGATRIETELSDQPEIQASLQFLIGQAYKNLGRDDKAEIMLESALKLRRETFEPNDLRIAESLYQLGVLYEHRHDMQRAEPLYEEFLEIYETRFGRGGHPYVLVGLYHLTGIAHLSGNTARADSLFERWHALHDQLGNTDDSSVAFSMSGMGEHLFVQRRYDEAEAILRQALAMQKRLYGPRHPEIGGTLNRLCWTLNAQKVYHETIPVAQEAISLHRALYPEGHLELAYSLSALGEAQMGLNRLDEAEALFLEDLAIREKLYGNNHPSIARGNVTMAQLLHRQERLPEAEQRYRMAIATYEGRFGSNFLMTILTKENLSQVLIDQDKMEEAEQILLDSFERLKARRGVEHSHTQEAVRRLISLYEKWDRPTEAEEYRAVLQPTDADPLPQSSS